MTQFVSRKRLTWQGQGSNNKPMESRPFATNCAADDQSFPDRSRAKMSNLEESLIRHGLTADRFDIEDCPEGKKITIRKAVAPPMPTDAEWQDHLDGNAEIYGTGFCYFIGAVGMSLVKIGYAANVKARLNHMQVNSPVELVLLAVAPGGAYRERAYHFQFGEHRVRGEWFERCPEIEAEIARLAA